MLRPWEGSRRYSGAARCGGRWAPASAGTSRLARPHRTDWPADIVRLRSSTSAARFGPMISGAPAAAEQLLDHVSELLAGQGPFTGVAIGCPVMLGTVVLEPCDARVVAVEFKPFLRLGVEQKTRTDVIGILV